jgi:uncharacterized membrane protein
MFSNRASNAGKGAPRALALMMAGCFAVMASATANAGYVVSTVDYPGSTFTQMFGINNAGLAVGVADDGASTGFGFTAQANSDGTFTLTQLPPAPGGFQTSALGINDAGTIVGSAGPGDGSANVGFVLHGSVYTYFSYPGRAFTFPRAINSAGLITGYAQAADGSDSVGFLYNPLTGVFTDITVPGQFFIIAQGINSAGQVVGSANVPGNVVSFLRDPSTGSLTYFDVNGTPTRARGINNLGLITGAAIDTSVGKQAAFVGNSSTGYQFLPITTESYTFGEAINDFGQVAGIYGNDDGTTHGFVAIRFPSTKADCMKGGWQTFGVFKNQGDCVSFVATGGSNAPAGQ